MEKCMAYAQFADAVLFTDAGQVVAQDLNTAMRIVDIPKLESAMAYSDFMLRKLVDFIETDHCLVVQWDGHIIDPARWRPEFLDYDYVGASWPQFSDGYNVGNGGFSLRSHRMMKACLQSDFEIHHPEDVAICRSNRAFLEGQGMRFAPAALADAFSAERSGDPSESFGYHGVFLMPSVLGTDRFWEVYQSLDDRSSVRHDFGHLLKSLQCGQNLVLRSLRMIANRMFDSIFNRKHPRQTL
ncbi:MAG: DUF5672 family protein [Alteraurantiacibacter sp.]